MCLPSNVANTPKLFSAKHELRFYRIIEDAFLIIRRWIYAPSIRHGSFLLSQNKEQNVLINLKRCNKNIKIFINNMTFLLTRKIFDRKKSFNAWQEGDERNKPAPGEKRVQAYGFGFVAKASFFPITHVIRRAILPRKLIPFLIKRYECESIATNVRVWSLTNEEICLDCLKNSDLSLFGCFYLALSVWDASTETTQILLFIRELSINLLLLFVLDIFFCCFMFRIRKLCV